MAPVLRRTALVQKLKALVPKRLTAPVQKLKAPAAKSKELTMAGLGYRREMSDWDMSDVKADFFEVIAENWIRRDPAPLLQLIDAGRAVHLHGVSLNLGGSSPINAEFVQQVGVLQQTLGTPFYSDHLAASGDAHQLYDLFPIPFFAREVVRIGDRIREVQDILGRRMAIENPTWYTNIGDMPEAEFLAAVADYADCNILLDLNNIDVNYKNHQQQTVDGYLTQIDFSRVNYLHVAGHEYDPRFDLYVDTHSRAAEPYIRDKALELQKKYGLPILLEWDNDVPDIQMINQELLWLTSGYATAPTHSQESLAC
tara:strand:+ start:3800 stop:4735 length:936 start_codon:yes stop_codon:yes gene_type:complete